MLNIATLKDNATYKSFHCGEELHHLNRILFFYKEEIEKGAYKVEAIVKDTLEYDVNITIDMENDKIIDAHCSCPYNYGGLCKHIVAAGLHFITKQAEELSAHSQNGKIIQLGRNTKSSGNARSISVTPKIHTYIRYGSKEHELLVETYADYGYGITFNVMKWSDPSASDHFKISNNAQTLFVKRDMETEHEAYRFIRQLLWEYRVGSGFVFSGNDEVHYLITEFIPYVPTDWVLHFDKGLEDLRVEPSTVTLDLNLNLTEGTDWFEFDINLHCQQLNVNMDQLKAFVKSNKKYLGIGWNFIDITNKEELKRFIDVLEKFESENSNPAHFTGKLYHAPQFNKLIEENSAVYCRSTDSFKNFMDELKTGRSIEKVEIKDDFKDILRGYQKDGLNWMKFLQKYGFGGILADDMGLGKTLQTLVLLKYTRKMQPSIVICPKTLVYNWYSEVLKFTPDMKVLIIEGAAHQRMEQIRHIREYDLVITSYSVVMQDANTYKHIDFEYCIIDEAQYIKNPGTKTAKAVKMLNSKYRLALTGTPLENNLVELWSIFDFLMPGFLDTMKQFRDKYEVPAVKLNNPAVLNDLNTKIKPFILRRTKKEMLKELPPKIEQVYYCDLTVEQLAMYTKILGQVRNNIFQTVERKGFDRSRIEILAALTRLRQVCNHPGLLDEQFAEKYLVSGKMEMFDELIDSCLSNGHKLLVFSQFTKMLGILKHYLDAYNIHYTYLDGQSRNRQEIIEDFNHNESTKVFLISIKAGGFGLNLTAADTVIIYDPWWNPMVEMQAADRAYRIGQTNTVNVYKFVTRGTVEEKIVKLQEKKKFLFDNIINENNEFMKKLTWEDLREVFD